MSTSTPATVTGAVFKAFWDDPNVWTEDMSVDDVLLVVNGEKAPGQDVRDLRDDDAVSIESGYFMSESRLPGGHFFAGKEDGDLARLLAMWLAAGMDKIAARESYVRRLDELIPMSTPDLLTAFRALANDAKPMEAILVDRAMFETLLTKIERQTSFLAYDASCQAATIESMPKSWSSYVKNRFIDLAKNALGALQGKVNHRTSQNYLVETQRAESRLIEAIGRAELEMGKPVSVAWTAPAADEADVQVADRPRG